MGRLGCYGLLLAIGMIVGGFAGGCQGVYTALTNWSPVETTCATYATERPDAAWLKVTGCQADLLNTVYEERLGGRIDRLWIPLVPEGAPEDADAVIVLDTEDDAVIAKFQRVLDSMDGDPSQVVAAMADAMSSEALASFEGTVRFGWELDDEERGQVAALGERLTEDFVIVDHGNRPSLLWSLALIGVGCAGVALLLGMVAALGRSAD